MATKQDTRSDFTSAHPGLTYVLVLFLSWVALSQLWAEDSGQALTEFSRLALNALLFLIIFTAVRTPTQAIGFVAAFVGGACIDGLYGMLFATSNPGTASRLSSSITNPNELATILVAALVLEPRVSGGPETAAAGALGSAGCGRAVHRRHLPHGLPRRPRLLGGRAGRVPGRGGPVARPDACGRRGGGSRRVRILQLRRLAGDQVPCLERGQRHRPPGPVDGRLGEWSSRSPYGASVGGTFRSHRCITCWSREPSHEATSSLGHPKVAHNTYLELWAELGLVGLILFLSVAGFCLYSALKAAGSFARQGDDRMEVIARTLFVALAGLLAADFFGSRLTNKEIWLLLGLAPALLAIARSREPTGERLTDVLVLGYHAVSERWPAALSIAPSHLEEHVRMLADRGFRGVTFHEAVLRPPSAKTLAITFDDAYRSVIELAFPILSRAGFSATVFAPTDFVGTEEPMAWPGIDHWRETKHAEELVPMSWEELERLAQAGWEIGSHTRSHPRLPDPRRRCARERAPELASGHRASPGRSLSVSRLSVRGPRRPRRRGGEARGL